MSAPASAPPRGATPFLPSPTLAIAPTFNERLSRKVRESPATFGFLGLTVGALTLGLRSLSTGDKRQSQLMMRFRVLFQFCASRALHTHARTRPRARTCVRAHVNVHVHAHTRSPRSPSPRTLPTQAASRRCSATFTSPRLSAPSPASPSTWLTRGLRTLARCAP